MYFLAIDAQTGAQIRGPSGRVSLRRRIEQAAADGRNYVNGKRCPRCTRPAGTALIASSCGIYCAFRQLADDIVYMY